MRKRIPKFKVYHILYELHYNPLLSTIHKDRFLKKNLEKKELVFKYGVKNIQAVAYNGLHKVEMFIWYFKKPSKSATITFTFQNHNGVSRWIPYIWRWLQLLFYWNKIGVHKKQPRSPCRWILFPNSSILLAIPTILCH